jgi:hypothetical protein
MSVDNAKMVQLSSIQLYICKFTKFNKSTFSPLQKMLLICDAECHTYMRVIRQARLVLVTCNLACNLQNKNLNESFPPETYFHSLPNKTALNEKSTKENFLKRITRRWAHAGPAFSRKEVSRGG